MKNSNTNKIGSAQRFTHWAAVLTLAASLVIMGLFTACPNAAGGGGTSSDGNTGGGGGTPQSKYTVNFNVEDGNGFLIAKVGDTIIDSGAQVKKDTTVTFTAIEKTGYRVYGWTLNGTVVNDTKETYSLTIDKDVTVMVSFEDAGSPPKPRYNVYFQEFGKGSISAQVDGNTITPDTKVQKDKTVLFTATPDSGYKVQKWQLNGRDVNGTAETYSLTLTTHVRVQVYFERDAPKYPVNFSVDGDNGTLKASFAGFVPLDTGDTIYEGDEVRFTAAPAAGYRITGWSRNGGYLSVAGTGNTYSEPITSDVTVKVAFELDVPNYTVNFGTEGGNGTLTADGPNSQPITTGTEIAKGKKVYFTAEPAPGYMTDSWTISGGSFEAGTGTPENPLATVTVNAPLTVKVSFKPADSIPLSKLDIEGTILKGYTGEKPSGKLRVPAHITEIADYAFMECTGITEVHLPESLTKIGNNAFGNCSGITKLTMGKNLTRIGEYAFNDCFSLKGKLEFPPNLGEIGELAFVNCRKVSGLDFSKCTQPLTIGNNAFQSCIEIIGTVKLPARLSSLGQSAFWACDKVALFDFYACKNPPLTAIGTDAFYGTNSRFKVKTGTGIKTLLTASGVAAGRIDED